MLRHVCFVVCTTRVWYFYGADIHAQLTNELYMRRVIVGVAKRTSELCSRKKLPIIIISDKHEITFGNLAHACLPRQTPGLPVDCYSLICFLVIGGFIFRRGETHAPVILLYVHLQSCWPYGLQPNGTRKTCVNVQVRLKIVTFYFISCVIKTLSF